MKFLKILNLLIYLYFYMGGFNILIIIFLLSLLCYNFTCYSFIYKLSTTYYSFYLLRCLPFICTRLEHLTQHKLHSFPSYDYRSAHFQPERPRPVLLVPHSHCNFIVQKIPFNISIHIQIHTSLVFMLECKVTPLPLCPFILLSIPPRTYRCAIL